MNARQEIQRHFEEIAPRYDWYKERNKGYYQHLKRLYRDDFAIPPGQRVLEIGCGTGEILASLDPAFGVGIDLIPRMVEIAAAKFADRPELHFIAAEAETLPIDGAFDWIILPDVLEHLYDLERAVEELGRIARPGTGVIVSWANPRWEPVLGLLEKLKMKMPEGPHCWHPPATVITLFQRQGFRLRKVHDRFPFPPWPARIERWFAGRERKRGTIARIQLILGAFFEMT